MLRSIYLIDDNMIDPKELTKSAHNIDNHFNDSDELRSELVGTIIDILSQKTRNNKQDMIELKKRIHSILDFDPNQLDRLEEFKDFKKMINDLIINDEDADGIISCLNILSWMNDVGLGKDVDKDDYNYDMISEEARDQFMDISKRYSQYSNSFSTYYKKLGIDYMHRYKKVPNYIFLLRKSFCNYVSRYINQTLKKIKFNEEECREGFGAIQETLGEIGLSLEASDNIKQDFIKLCREEFPLAPKKDNFLMENKNFKQNFIEYITNGLDKYLEKIFDDIVKDCTENTEQHVDELENFGGSEGLSSEYLHNIFLLFNIAVGTIASINWMIDEGSWSDNVIGLYFQHIADQFKYDHLKKQEKASANENSATLPQIDLKNSKIFTSEKTKGWEKTLSEEENNLIKEAASYIDCDKKRSIIKYITKLKMKDLPIRFYDFKRLFNLKEIPPLTESILIDKLGMDYEVEEEELVAEEEILKEKATKKAADKNEVCLQEKLIIDNPTDYLIDKLKVAGCKFDNEATARKQIDEFCLNDNYKTVLINLMRSPRFGKVFIHKPGHKTARLLRVGRTGWRILFSKRKDGKLHFICFGNHNYYEDRLAMLK